MIIVAFVNRHLQPSPIPKPTSHFIRQTSKHYIMKKQKKRRTELHSVVDVDRLFVGICVRSKILFYSKSVFFFALCFAFEVAAFHNSICAWVVFFFFFKFRNSSGDHKILKWIIKSIEQPWTSWAIAGVYSCVCVELEIEVGNTITYRKTSVNLLLFFSL